MTWKTNYGLLVFSPITFLFAITSIFWIKQFFALHMIVIVVRPTSIGPLFDLEKLFRR